MKNILNLFLSVPVVLFCFFALIIELWDELGADCVPVAIHVLRFPLQTSFSPGTQTCSALLYELCWIGADVCWKQFLQVWCQNIPSIRCSTFLFNMPSISWPMLICTHWIMSFPAPGWAALLSSSSASLLSVCLFNMQRRSLGESLWTSVNESATMISWQEVSIIT